MTDQERTEKVRACRPQINLSYNPLEAKEELIFQNDVLRPILKFQNKIILGLFYEYCLKRKISLGQLSEKEKKDLVDNALGKDQRLKNTLLGAIIGLFTEEELKYYLMRQRDVSKRIMSMLKERIRSQI